MVWGFYEIITVAFKDCFGICFLVSLQKNLILAFKIIGTLSF